MKSNQIDSTTSRNFDFLVEQTSQIISSSHTEIVKSINFTMLLTYFKIGETIINNEQNGQERAGYAKGTLKELSKTLTSLFGKGFSHDNLQNMRRLYIAYKNYETVSRISQGKLGWSHFITLLNMDTDLERAFYEIESAKNNWSVRELKRQYNSSLYERLALSKDKKDVIKLSEQGHILEKPQDTIKDPLVLEFLGLKEEAIYSEKDLETKIIDNLQNFLLELGKGFAFVSRQKRISFDNKHFYIDLVFYNWILKCFVLIDLKIGELVVRILGRCKCM